MATLIGTGIVTDGLVFHYNLNSSQSWKGKPTTNFTGNRGFRKTDSSYSLSTYNPGGRFLKNHPNSITVYFLDGGSAHTAYNGGVADATNTHHGYHIYDEDLREPVFRMRDVDGQWKARSVGLGKTWSEMGLTTGDTYTISWKQKTTNLSKTSNIGLYGKNTSNALGFHDGRSPGQGTGVKYNTKINTWEQLYATFTLGSTFDASSTYDISVYGYGHYVTRAELRVTDLQIEKGSFSGYHHSISARGNTSCLFDVAGTQSLNVANTTPTSDGGFEFDGTDDRIDFGSDVEFKSSGGWTVESWVKYDSVPGSYNNTTSPGNFIGSEAITHNSWYWSVLDGKLSLWNKSPGIWRQGSTTLQANTWYQAVLVSNSNGTSYQMYLNGAAEGGNHTTYSWNSSYSGLKVRYIGQGNTSNVRRVNGKIYATRIYDRALTANEVKQNFEAERHQYGI